MTREALDGDDLEARSGDGHHRAAGKGENHPHPQKSPAHGLENPLIRPLVRGSEDRPTILFTSEHVQASSPGNTRRTSETVTLPPSERHPSAPGSPHPH
ncbi:hypothetical protein GCM10028793_02430 [Nocardiopsis oceani]